MAVCPVDLCGRGQFCCMALLNDEIHVFGVFSEEGEQPMIAAFHSLAGRPDGGAAGLSRD
ncbi:MAG: hypothetical protein R3D53_13380 [Paracoccaceae bacterium]